MRVDLHTHSIGSKDGALRETHYKQMLESGRLDYIAITDHNTIDFAKKMFKIFGRRIIIGEEVTTSQGEVIGLYLKQPIEPGLSMSETVNKIKEQGGLVYAPHPFETVRKGMTEKVLDSIADQVDMVEAYNGRAVFQNKSKEAVIWSAKNKVSCVAASDAHGWYGWGRTYSFLDGEPTKENLVKLAAGADFVTGWPGVLGLLYPKFNRFLRRG